MNIQDLSDAERAKLGKLHQLYDKHEPVAVDVFYTWRSKPEQLCLCSCGQLIGTHELNKGEYDGEPSYEWEESVRFSFVCTVYLASPEWARDIIRKHLIAYPLEGQMDNGQEIDTTWLISLLGRQDICRYVIERDRFAAMPKIPCPDTVAKLEHDGIIKSIKAG